MAVYLRCPACGAETPSAGAPAPATTCRRCGASLVVEASASTSEPAMRAGPASPIPEPTPLRAAFAKSSEITDVAPDPWRHRTLMMCCTTCMWFVVKRRNEFAAARPPGESGLLGRCRRRAPELGGWPAVFEADWCGDHKLDENRA